MLVGKILKKTTKQSEDASSSCLIPIIILMLIATLLLKIISWTVPEKIVPLLSKTDGLVQLVHTEDIPNYTSTIFLIPKETIGASQYVIGVYTETSPKFPKGSVALVYVKDNQRLFEIDELTDGLLVEQKQLYPEENQEEIILDKSNKALIVKLNNTINCTSKYVESHPSMCKLTDVLIFEKNELLIKIYVDGKKLTQGELISIAKSIIEQ